MKINWKVRLQNKAFLLTMISAVVAFIYQICGIIGIVPPIGEDMVIQLIGLVLNILVGIGILVDPTTVGLDDSKRALNYKSLGKGEADEN